MPYLSTRLYVDLNLTPILESLLGVASYAGIAIRVVFFYQLLVKKSIRRQEYLVLRKFVCLKFFFVLTGREVLNSWKSLWINSLNIVTYSSQLWQSDIVTLWHILSSQIVYDPQAKISHRFFSTIIKFFRHFAFQPKLQTRLLVSGRSPECSDCLLRFMEQ